MQGDANKLHKYFKPGSFDLVLAALSDHLDDHEAFYRAARRVLKPGGVLVVSYPAKQLMHAIRTRLYGIPANQTRFRVGGREYRISSTLRSPQEVMRLLARAGFKETTADEVKHKGLYDALITETIKQGCKLLDKKPHETPIVVVAAAKKPTKQERLHTKAEEYAHSEIKRK